MSEQGQGPLLEQIAAVLEDRHEGALLIVGAPGVGKTHLLRSAGAAAALPIVSIPVNPAEAAWALSGLSTMLATLDPRAAEFAGRFALRGLDPAALQAATADILSLLRGLQLDPMVVFVDDIDRMDPVSQALLGVMAGRLAGTGIRLVASARWLSRDNPLAGFPRGALRPLRRSQALDLALSEGGAALDAGTAQILVARSAGNPAVLLTQLRRLTEGQRAGRETIRFPLAAPAPASAITRRRLRGLGPDLLRLVQVLSLAPLSHPDALCATRLATLDEIDDLVRAGLAEELDPYVRLASPLVRSTMHDDVAAHTRRAWHAALAEGSRGIAVGIADWHASAADPELRHSNALLRGAVELLDDGFAEAAVELADRALLRREDPPEIWDVLEFARRLTRRGEGPLATRYLTRIAQEKLGHRERSAHAFAVLRADLDRIAWPPHAAVVAALEFHGDADPIGAVEVAGRAALLHALRGDPEAASFLLRLAGPFRDRASCEGIRLMGVVEDLVATPSTGRRATAEVSPLVDASRASAPEIIARARAATLHEDYADSARLYSLALELPRSEDPDWQDFARVLLAENAVRSGHLDEALTAISRLRAVRLRDPLLSLQEVLEAWADAASGRPDRARDRMEAWVASRRGTEGLESAIGHALLGRLALMTGDPATAVQELSHADLLATGVRDPGVLRHHPALIEALIEAEEPARAQSALARFEAAAARYPTRWAALALARTRALVADGARAIELFDSALGALTHADPPLERARLLAHKGRRLRASGLPSANAVLFEARVAFEVAGAAAWAQEGSFFIPGRPPAPTRGAAGPVFGTLSDAEWEVAQLVRLGFHNKEIAARLFVSLRTVELRLTRIYRKTGARSRSHLAALLS